MPSALAHVARIAPYRLLLWGTAAAAVTLLAGSAGAQVAGGSNSQAAYREWRRLSQGEVNCVDRSLRRQGTRLWTLIERGVRPSSAAVAKLRAGCRAQAATQDGEHRRPSADQSASQVLASADPTRVKITTTIAAPAEKATPDQAAAEQAAAEQAIAEQAAAAEQAMAKAAAEKAAAERAAAEKAAADRAKAEVRQASTAAAVPATDLTEHADKSAQTPAADKTSMFSVSSPAAESRMSFIYGLVSGPVLMLVGGLAVFFTLRRRNIAAPTETAGEGEFDRLVTAVTAEIVQRQRPDVAEPAVPRERLPIH